MKARQSVQDSDWREAISLAANLIASLKKEYFLFILSAFFLAVLLLLPTQIFIYFNRSLSYIDHNSYYSFAVKLGLLGIAISICLAGASFGKTILKERLQLKLENRLRRLFFWRLHGTSLEKLEDVQRGSWMTSASKDIQLTEDFLGHVLPETLYQFFIFAGAACFLFKYAGLFAMVPIAFAVLMGLINLRLHRALAPYLSEMRQLHAQLFQLLLEDIEGAKIIRSHGVARQTWQRSQKQLDLFYQKGMRVARRIGAALSTNEFMTQIVFTVSLLWLAAGYAQGFLSTENALAAPFYLGQFFFSLRAMVTICNGWNRFFIHGAHIAHLRFEEGSQERAEAIVDFPSPEQLHLKISNLTFSSSSSKQFSLESLSLTPGQVSAIVGPSGSGKSTALEVLAGLRFAKWGGAEISRNQHGKVETFWKSDAPEPTRSPSQYFSYVEQKPFIFQATLRENIAFGQTISDIDLEGALKDVGLDDRFFDRDGLDTLITDRGNNLSEGQLYRVALARALCLRRPFILLDEPFASLDSETIEKIVLLFEKLKEKKSILIVTHYLPLGLKIDTVYKINPKSSKNDFFEGFHSGKPVAVPDSRIATQQPELSST